MSSNSVLVHLIHCCMRLAIELRPLCLQLLFIQGIQKKLIFFVPFFGPLHTPEPQNNTSGKVLANSFREGPGHVPKGPVSQPFFAYWIPRLFSSATQWIWSSLHLMSFECLSLQMEITFIPLCSPFPEFHFWKATTPSSTFEISTFEMLFAFQLFIFFWILKVCVY